MPNKPELELISTDDEIIDNLPPIKNDEEAEEVFAARDYAKRTNRWVIKSQSVVIVLFALAIYGLAVRPVRRVYIPVGADGRVVANQYMDLEHFTPDTVMARTYLEKWAQYRFGRLRATVLNTFPNNYLFLQKEYGHKIEQQELQDNIAANVAAGREPENDITAPDVTITSFGKQSVGSDVYPGGSAVIVFRKIYPKDPTIPPQTWIVPVRFYLNPGQVNEQSKVNPEYQQINPLGLTIVEFVPNHQTAKQ